MTGSGQRVERREDLEVQRPRMVPAKARVRADVQAWPEDVERVGIDEGDVAVGGDVRNDSNEYGRRDESDGAPEEPADGRARRYSSASLVLASPNLSRRTPMRSISDRYRLQALRLSSPAFM